MCPLEGVDLFLEAIFLQKRSEKYEKKKKMKLEEKICPRFWGVSVDRMGCGPGAFRSGMKLVLVCSRRLLLTLLPISLG